MRDIIQIENEDDFKLFCLECVEDIEVQKDSQLLDFLEHLAREFQITNVYKTTDSFEGFEESLTNLLYHDKYFRDYKIIYLVFEGEGNQIQIDDYYYSLEEVAEIFQGKLTDKIVHFSNTMNLDLEDESFQYFIDVTGVKALSGYVNPSPILSTILDQYYFCLAKEIDDEEELVHALFDKHSILAQKLGFRLYH